jgi:hypothetical protein
VTSVDLEDNHLASVSVISNETLANTVDAVIEKQTAPKVSAPADFNVN